MNLGLRALPNLGQMLPKRRGRPRKDPVGWNALPVPPSLPNYSAAAAAQRLSHSAPQQVGTLSLAALRVQFQHAPAQRWPLAGTTGSTASVVGAASLAAQHVPQPVPQSGGMPLVAPAFGMASLAHPIAAEHHAGRLPMAFALPAQAPAQPMEFSTQLAPTPAPQLKLTQKLHLIAGELGVNIDTLSVAGAVKAASAAIGEDWQPDGHTVAQQVEALMVELGMACAVQPRSNVATLAMPSPAQVDEASLRASPRSPAAEEAAPSPSGGSGGSDSSGRAGLLSASGAEPMPMTSTLPVDPASPAGRRLRVSL